MSHFPFRRRVERALPGLSRAFRLALLGLTLGALFLSAAPVSAHAYLLRSTPAANAHLDHSPAQIDMFFSEPLEPQLSDIAVYDAGGARVDQHTTRLDPADATHLSASLPPLKDGIYLVTWKVISISDGHLTGGSFPILIGDVSAGAASTLQAAPPAPASTLPGQALVKGLLYLAVAILAGGAIFERFAWRPAARALGEEQAGLAGYAPLLRRYFLVGLALLGTASLLGVLVEAAAFEGGWILPPWDPEVLTILTGARYGLLALARLAALFALAGVLLPSPNRWNRWAALPLLALLLLSVSLGSHAAAQSNPWMIAADLAHLLAASVWVGGLGLFLASLWWARRWEPQQRTRLAAFLLPRFSTLAMISVGVLGLTGVYAALTDVGSWDGLLNTDYGRVLLVKLLAALVMLALGGVNHFVIRPRIQAAAQVAPGDASRVQGFLKFLSAEAALGALLLLWVGVFTSLPMANEQASIPRLTQTLQADDLTLKLTVSPGRVGVNTYTLALATSADGKPLTQANEVDLLFFPSDVSIPPSTAVLANQGNGIYSIQGAYLSFADLWQVRVAVRRPDRFDTFADFSVDTRPGGSLPQNVVAGTLLGLTALAAAFAVYMLAGRKGGPPLPANF